MSTPVDTTLTGLKALPAQIKAIIYGAQQIPLGPSHYALTSQVTGLVAGSSSQGPWGWTPAQHHPFMLQGAHASPEHDSFDLPVAAPPSTGPIPVDLPSSPVHTSNVTGPSTNPTTKYQDKGKGKAVFADLEAEVEGSRKRKSPMILEPSSQPPKSAMKSHKHMRSTRAVKSKPFMELEDNDQLMIKPFSGGVLEVVLPRLSTIIVRTPNSPHSPRVLTKQPFSPATAIAGSHLAGVKPPQQTPEALVQAPPVIDAGAILIPRPNNPCQACNKQDWPCTTWLDKRTKNSCMSCVYCMTKKIKCISTTLGSLPKRSRAPSTTRRVRSKTPSKAPSKAPPASQSTARTRTLLSSSSAVPHAALNVPMLDLHAIAIVIWDGAARIALLEAQVAEQDGMVPTPPTPEDASAIEGLVFEDNEVVHPEDPNTSSEHVDPGNPGNLVPGYDSADDMDVEVKVEASSEETDMAT
ncbi:hypothetical protein EDB19DRAFT_1831196 [Suillus lakei]|nr:hypothetical protein EDB19DRAFT_1831196 [Suillus lakei]